MYTIEHTDYGIRLTFGGFMQQEEMEQWYQEFVPAVDAQTEGFHVFVDMRELKPLPPEAQAPMEHGQKHARQGGMVRSVVVLANPITMIQFQRLAKQTGIYEYERYISAEDTPNWEQVGMDWIIRNIDPDK